MARPSVKEVIVESALSEFHRRGFNACSVEDITRAAGVPKGSFYNHFASKEALGAEVVRRYAAASVFRAEFDTDLTPLAGLRERFTRSRERIVADEFSRGCLLGNMGTEVSTQSAPIRAEVETSMARWSSRIADQLRAAQSAGEIAAERDVDQLAEFIVNSWEGAVTRAKVVQSAKPLDDFLAVVFGQLLH